MLQLMIIDDINYIWLAIYGLVTVNSAIIKKNYYSVMVVLFKHYQRINKYKIKRLLITKSS
jgi:hypothetical protein